MIPNGSKIMELVFEKGTNSFQITNDKLENIYIHMSNESGDRLLTEYKDFGVIKNGKNTKLIILNEPISETTKCEIYSL